MENRDRTLILADNKRSSMPIEKWEEIGEVVTEISELYQLIKERDIDLILVDQERTELKRTVANRIRRHHSLTEIWRVGDDHDTDLSVPDYFDGALRSDAEGKSIADAVARILKSKDLLDDFKMVGRSQRIKTIAETIDRIAPTDVSVLIVGPSGAGKELVAHAIHEQSRRRNKTYVAINCGAIAEGLLESELFGHEKGAFTGSVSKREGMFSKADGGTIFLDEIGETKPEMQVKLLRILEDGTYYPVGSSVAQKSDARVISATNRDLIEAIEERQFREDLYFRISVVKIIVPPLLDRLNDIQPLLTHFWRKPPKMTYTDSALELLMQYDWPGNVRQLKNFADRMVALIGSGTVTEEDVQSFLDEQQSMARNLPVATGKTVEESGQELIYHAILSLGNEIKMLRDLITSHLPGESDTTFATTDDEIAAGGTMEAMERQMIEQSLKETSGNRKETARRLGIGERTLYRKLKKYDLN